MTEKKIHSVRFWELTGFFSGVKSGQQFFVSGNKYNTWPGQMQMLKYKRLSLHLIYML